jgi:hypothetical protein
MEVDAFSVVMISVIMPIVVASLEKLLSNGEQNI